MDIQIENYFELLALHKTLMAVKFDKNACLPEAQGSPYTASLAFKVFDSLIALSIKDGKTRQADGWRTWQKADLTRIESELLQQKISDSDWWDSADLEKRKKYINDFMAPLVLDEQSLNVLLKDS